MWKQEEMQPQVSGDGRKRAKETFQDKLRSKNASLFDCTVYHFLNDNGLHGRRPRWAQLLTKKPKRQDRSSLKCIFTSIKISEVLGTNET